MADTGIRMNNLPSRDLAQVFGIDPDGTVARQDIEMFIQALLTGAGATPEGLPAEIIRAKAAEAVLATQSYVGELLRSASTLGNAANGAVLQTDGPQIIGLAIPPGATASGSFVRINLPLGPGEIAGLTGRTIRMVALAEITPGFTDAHPLTGEPAAIIDDTGFRQAGTVVNASPVGDRLAYTIDYTVTGRERSIGITIALANGSGAASGQSFYVRSLTYRVVADPLPSALGIGGATVPYSRSTLAAEPTGIGLEISDLSFNPAFVNGASVSAYRGRPLGIAVPAGQTGRTSYVEYVAPLDPSELAALRGSFIRVVMGFDTSAADFSLPLNVAVKFDTTGSVPGGQIIRFAGQYRQYFYLVVIDTWVPDSARDLRGTIQISDTGTTATSDLFIRLREIDARVLIPRGGVSLGHPYTGADLTARLRASRLMRKAAARAALGVTALRQATDTVLVLSVDIGGLGDAIAAADTRGVGERFQIQVPRGIFTGAGNFDTHLPDHIDLQGWDSSASRIVGYQPPDTSLAAVAAKSTLNKEASGRIAGLRVTAEGCRYVLHNDFSLPAFGLGIKQVIEDCHFEHLGNEEVRAYQTANGGDASQVWRSTAAIGYGLGDGGELVIRRCTVKGKDFTALTGHDGPGFTYAPRLTVEDCTLTPQRDPTLELGWSFLYGLLGSGQSTVISMSGNTLPNPIVLGIGSWQQTDLSNQLADKIGGLIWRGSGNTATPYLLRNDGSAALRIDALTPGANLSLAGSAVALLFGELIPVREAPGLPGGSYGTWDVGEHQIGAASNIANPSLGARLGDRRSSPATLTVASGSSSATITFSQNYTSTSNASILSTINAAISNFAAASLFVVNDLFRPCFSDEEAVLLNTGSTTILRKMGVAYDAMSSTCRVATNSDAAVDFAGIAYEDIRPGQSGRVKTGGALRVSQDLLRSDTGSFQRGAVFGIGSTPGRFTINPEIALMRATTSMDVSFFLGGGQVGPPGPPTSDAQITGAYLAWAKSLPVYSGDGDAPVPAGQAYNLGPGGPVVIAQ